MSKLTELRNELSLASSAEKANNSARFFKTGPGQYGESDIFIGISVPDQRKIAKNYEDLSLNELENLLKSKIHEERLISLIILVNKFQHGNQDTKANIYNFYISHTININNWDLVDSSAEYIVGPWLENKDKSILTSLARSNVIWERRIAMLATFHYIKQEDPKDALKIAELLLNDNHDLIQKAVGWMLREIGKRCSLKVEEKFLAHHYKSMSRTTLRYAIERFPKTRREQYLKSLV
jgi:3-methyladenine DNA glycosylase AlkD